MDDPLARDWPAPDPLDVVLDLDSTMAACAAERLQRIDELRRIHLADAALAGRSLTDVVLRGLRLELAAAMRITEHAAGGLIARAEALVHRYPEALTAFRRGRITERHAELLVDGLDEWSLNCEVNSSATRSHLPRPSRLVCSADRFARWSSPRGS